jgi:Fic family protein
VTLSLSIENNQTTLRPTALSMLAFVLSSKEHLGATETHSAPAKNLARETNWNILRRYVV